MSCKNQADDARTRSLEVFTLFAIFHPAFPMSALVGNTTTTMRVENALLNTTTTTNESSTLKLARRRMEIDLPSISIA